MSFEIQELSDVIKIITLLNTRKDEMVPTSQLKSRLDKICGDHVCIEMSDVNRTLKEMVSEGLIVSGNGMVQLTEQGARLGNDWRNLLLKREPILEVVAGLTDGSITGLVVILSAFIARLPSSVIIFAAFLTLASVAITNFSSFLLGGITEDISDIVTLQNLVNYSLSDIPDKKERDKSLSLVKQLFSLLHKQISRANLYSATLCGTMTFLAGIIPIATYIILSAPLDLVLSLTMVGAVIGGLLVRYRSKRSKVHWKVTLFQTVIIILIAVGASMLLGGGI